MYMFYYVTSKKKKGRGEVVTIVINLCWPGTPRESLWLRPFIFYCFREKWKKPLGHPNFIKICPQRFLWDMH